MADAPKEALEKWYEDHPYKGRSDTPSVSVWYPYDAPTSRLQVVSHGCDPDTLPNGPVTAYLKIAGVEIGGPLDDLEQLIEAAKGALSHSRDLATKLQAERDAL